MKCGWCSLDLAATRRDARFCGRKCRQSAFRLRRRRTTAARAELPMRCAYADPPYPGLARLYADQPTFGGEVDHVALIARLMAFDGWALSTGAYALREILPLCPPEVRVCAWVKPIGVSSKSHGLHNAWEPLLVMPCRRMPPGVRDWLSATPARFGGSLIGRKPIAFAAFLFDALGIMPGDSLDDLYPGTGIIGRAWAHLSSAGEGDVSSDPRGDVSSVDRADASPSARADRSPEASPDASSVGVSDGSRPGLSYGSSSEYSGDTSSRTWNDSSSRSTSDGSAGAGDDASPRAARDESSSRYRSDATVKPGLRVRPLE